MKSFISSSKSFKLFLIPILFVTFFSLFSGCSSTSDFISDDWPHRLENKDYKYINDNNSLGYFLHYRFRDYFKENFSPDKLDKYDDLDFIPKDIKRTYNGTTDGILTDKAKSLKINLGGLLLMPLNKTKVDLIKNSKILSGDKLPVDLILYDQTSAVRTMLLPHYDLDNMIWVEDQTEYIRANAEAGVTIPYLTLKAAYDGESREQSTIEIIGGTFQSPITKLTSTKEKLYYLLKIWDVYLDQNDTNYYYINRLTGLSIKTLSNTEKKSTLKITGQVGYSGPIGSIKANGDFENSYLNSFNSTEWNTYIVSDNLDDKFTQFPYPNQIINILKDVPLYVNREKLNSLRPGESHTHYIDLNIPQDLCDENKWRIDTIQPNIYQDIPHLYMHINPDGKKTTCECEITGNIKTSITTNPTYSLSNSTVELSYELIYARNHGTDSIKLFANRVIMPVYSKPNLSPTKQKVDYEPFKTQNQKISWQPEFLFIDGTDTIDFANNLSFRIHDVVVRGNDVIVNTTSINGSDITIPSNSNKIHFVITTDAYYDSTKYDFTKTPIDDYVFTGYLDIPLKTGRTITRLITCNFKFPIKK